MNTRFLQSTCAISRGLSVLLAAMALLASTPLLLLALTRLPWLPTGLALGLLGISFLPGIPDATRRRAAFWALGLCVFGALMAAIRPERYASAVVSISIIGRAAAMLVCLAAAASTSVETCCGIRIRSFGVVLAAVAVAFTCWATRIMDSQPAGSQTMTVWLLEFVPVTLLLAMSLLAHILGTSVQKADRSDQFPVSHTAGGTEAQDNQTINAAINGASKNNQPKKETR